MRGRVTLRPARVESGCYCGIAQCHASMGDSAGRNGALDLAHIKLEEDITSDAIGGLFEFTHAKQHYYAGSSLIWLPNKADAIRATQETTVAIDIWQQEPLGGPKRATSTLLFTGRPMAADPCCTRRRQSLTSTPPDNTESCSSKRSSSAPFLMSKTTMPFTVFPGLISSQILWLSSPR